MFGSYERTLDSKNRIVIPSKFRDELGDVLYITLNFEKALELRNKESFDTFSKKITSNNNLDSKFRQLSRYIFANTIEVNIDKNGRVLILDNLLKQATIDKEVIFIGIGDKVELWSKNRYEKMFNEFNEEENITKITNDLLSRGVVL